MKMILPELDDKVLINCDGEGQNFVRNPSGTVAVHTGSGDFSNAGGIDCVIAWLYWLPWGCGPGAP